MAGKLNASAQAQAPKSIDLKISESRVVLLAGNETHSAISMYWDTTGGSLMRPAKFIVQAAVRGTGFDAPVTLGTFTIPAVTFSVKALNEQMRLLFEPGKASMADIRIVGEYPDNTTVISNVMALEVTTYQPTRTFGPEQIFRIPGNYQSWKVPGAPQLISANEAGVYEGYIRFNCQYPQFLMVKGVNAWDPLATYTDIGGSKIGFNGNFFCLPKGGGTYRLKVNTNTNIWSYTKIESWALAGSAVSGKESTIQLKEEEDGLSWRVTTFLQRGSFRIRANDTDAISFGHNAEATVGVPDYDGAEIKVDKAGTYNVVLDLDDAGNYMYAVQRIN
ncbi:MAG: hypothetical protein JO301_12575 [Chitinophagaceae bacterium]|nr:hypothetical protein [Chitinophagaceae bacterium]